MDWGPLEVQCFMELNAFYDLFRQPRLKLEMSKAERKLKERTGQEKKVTGSEGKSGRTPISNKNSSLLRSQKPCTEYWGTSSPLVMSQRNPANGIDTIDKHNQSTVLVLPNCMEGRRSKPV